MRFGKILVSIVLASSAAMAAGPMDEWCVGYMEGYREGYTQTRGEEPHNVLPICPAKPVRPGDERRSEQQRGYDRGFKDGARDGSRQMGN